MKVGPMDGAVEPGGGGGEASALADESSTVEGRALMTSCMKSQRRPADPADAAPLAADALNAHRSGWDAEFSRVVHKAMDDHDEYIKQAELDELTSRNMVPSNCLHMIKLVLRDGGTVLTGSLPDSARFHELVDEVRRRCGSQLSGRIRLLWLTRSGCTIELTQRTFAHYTLAHWCDGLWTIFVHDEADGEPQAIKLTHTSHILFRRYDVNQNGRIEKRELLRLFQDLDLEQLQCSETFIENFIHGEFAALDTDGSEGLTKAEFTEYITSMNRFIRDELLVESNAHNVAARLRTSTAARRRSPPRAPFRPLRRSPSSWPRGDGAAGVCSARFARDRDPSASDRRPTHPG